jgi:hypothetical protein
MLDDIIALARYSGGDTVPMYKRLGQPDGGLFVREVTDVESETDGPDYYVVRLCDEATGEPLFGVCLTKEGFIMEAALLEPNPSPGPKLEDVGRALTARFGAGRARYVHVSGNIGDETGDGFSLVVRADAPAGRLYVDESRGFRVFRQESIESRTDSGKATGSCASRR